MYARAFFLWLFGCRFLYLKSIKTDIISLWPPLINSQRLHRWQVPLVGFATTILWQSFDLAHLFTVFNCQGVVVVDVFVWLSPSVTLIAFYWLWPRTKTVLGQWWKRRIPFSSDHFTVVLGVCSFVCWNAASRPGKGKSHYSYSVIPDITVVCFTWYHWCCCCRRLLLV